MTLKNRNTAIDGIEDFGGRVAAHMIRCKLKNTELAEILGCTSAFISRLKSNDSKPSYEMLVKLAKAFECTLTELTGE